MLVTGAAGFVGSHLVRRLSATGANVIGFVHPADLTTSPLSKANGRFNAVTGDLADFSVLAAVMAAHQFDTVFHLGAQALVGVGHRYPHLTFQSNIAGTYNLLEACRVHGPKLRRIIIASSDKAYGECVTGAYTEDSPLAATNPYDVSKSCTDLIAQTYFHSYGLPIAIARCGNIFGPGDLHWSRLVPGTIRSLLEGDRPLIRSDGTLVRDYLYIDDAVDAYLALAEWLDAPQSRGDTQRAFNFSSSHTLSVLDMVRHIQTACQRPDLSPIVQGTSVGEIAYQHLDCARAESILHWQSRSDLQQALTMTVKWYREYLAADDSRHCGVLSTLPLTDYKRASA